MAFNRERLICLGGHAKRGEVPIEYAYYNEDSDTVTETSYFEDVAMSAGDQITEVSADYTTRTNYYVSAISGGKATVTASS